MTTATLPPSENISAGVCIVNQAAPFRGEKQLRTVMNNTSHCLGVGCVFFHHFFIFFYLYLPLAAFISLYWNGSKKGVCRGF
jgi:hypothetical protein